MLLFQLLIPTISVKNLFSSQDLSKQAILTIFVTIWGFFSHKICQNKWFFQLFFQHFGKKSWKKVERFPYNGESAPLPGSKRLSHIHETARKIHILYSNLCVRISRCSGGIWCCGRGWSSRSHRCGRCRSNRRNRSRSCRNCRRNRCCECVCN